MRSIRIIAGIAGITLTALWSGMALAQQPAPAASSTAAKPAKPKVRHTAVQREAPVTTNFMTRFGSTSDFRPGVPQIYLLKGLADVFSSGMDTLQAKLRARGISSVVASHASSDRLADDVIARYRAGDRAPIIILGHSLGADAAVSMSQRLNSAHVPVALVVTFGPVGFPRVMGNVSRAVNFYQANSAWHGQIARGPGFRGSLKNIDLENAIDINHFNIEKADRLQAQAIAQIVSVIGHRHAPAKPAATAGAAPVAGAKADATPAQSAASGSAAPAKQN
jgi:pimeloyl-ACP methyl ester carboxylesterase